MAPARRQIPLAIALAEEGGFWLLALVVHRVGHACASSLLNHSHFAARRRRREVREVDRDFGAADVVHPDRQDRDAGALVPEGEVNALFRHRYRLDLCVDDHLGVGVESALSGGDSTCDATWILDVLGCGRLDFAEWRRI